VPTASLAMTRAFSACSSSGVTKGFDEPPSCTQASRVMGSNLATRTLSSKPPSGIPPCFDGM